MILYKIDKPMLAINPSGPNVLIFVPQTLWLANPNGWGSLYALEQIADFGKNSFILLLPKFQIFYSIRS
jgi:hypothetical protein